jgi:hypothetical protein
LQLGCTRTGRPATARTSSARTVGACTVSTSTVSTSALRSVVDRTGSFGAGAVWWWRGDSAFG